MFYKGGGYYLSGGLMILGSLILTLLHSTRLHENDGLYLEQINAEPHHGDVTVAVIPEVLGLAHQDLIKHLPVNVIHSNGNPVIIVNDTYLHQSQLDIQLQHKRSKEKHEERRKQRSLNKLLQESKKEGSRLSLSSNTSPCRHPSVTSRVSMTPQTLPVRHKSSLRKAGKRRTGNEGRSVSFTTSSPEASNTGVHSK